MSRHDFNVNLNAPRPWWVAIIISTFGWLFDFFDEAGKLSIGKTVIKGLIFIFLILQLVRCSDWTKEVRGIDPNLRTDGYFTMNWQHNGVPSYEMPEAGLFVIRDKREYGKLDNGISYIYPSDFREDTEYTIFPGMCQMLLRGQRARLSSHLPPEYVRGMKRDVIYDAPNNFAFFKRSRSFHTLARDKAWFSIPVSKGGYRQFIVQVRDDENGLVCAPSSTSPASQ